MHVEDLYNQAAETTLKGDMKKARSGIWILKYTIDNVVTLI